MLTVVLGLSTALLWGLPDVPLAVAVRRIGPLPVLAGSLLIGTVLIAPVGFFIERPEFTSKGVGLAILTGTLMAAGYAVGFSAFQRAPVSVVTPIISCEGAAAAAVAVALGEDLAAGLGLLMAAAVLGVVLVGTAGRSGERIPRAGLLFAVGASLIWGVVLYLGGPVTDELDTYWGFFLVRVAATVVMLPVLFRRVARAGIVAERRRVLIWAIGDTGGNLCFYAAAASGPVALASVLAAQFALFGTLAGVVWLGERLKTHQWVGVGVVIAAVSGIAAITA